MMKSGRGHKITERHNLRRRVARQCALATDEIGWICAPYILWRLATGDLALLTPRKKDLKSLGRAIRRRRASHRPSLAMVLELMPVV